MFFINKPIDEMTRKELLEALTDGDPEELEEYKGKRTTTLRKLLIEKLEDMEGDLYPNGRDPDAEDEDSI